MNEQNEQEQEINKEVSPETPVTTETPDDVEFEEVNEEGEVDIKASLKKLKEKVKKLEQEKTEYMNAWTRAQADYLNFKKEVETRRKDDILFANEKLITELLPTLDSFTLAKGNKEAWEKVDANWRMGIEYIFGQLYSTLEKEGLQEFAEVGDKFDPELHESIEVVSVDTEDKDNTLIAVLQKGYRLHKDVLRHAKVKTGHFEAK